MWYDFQPVKVVGDDKLMSNESPGGNDGGLDFRKTHARQFALAEMIASGVAAVPGIARGLKTPVEGFALGAMCVSVAAVALGDIVGFTKDPYLTFGFGTALFAGLSGLACGAFWWARTAGELPVPIWRALFLGGAVSASILSCAVVFAAFVSLGQMGSGSAIVAVFLGVMGIIMVFSFILKKFAIVLLALMIGWALVWRLVVNASIARRAAEANADAGKSP